MENVSTAIYSIDDYIQNKQIQFYTDEEEDYFQSTATRLYEDMGAFYSKEDKDNPTKHYVCFALLEDLIIGFNHFYIVEETRYCNIFSTYTVPKFRRQGIAKKNIIESVEFILSKQIISIEVSMVISLGFDKLILKEFYVDFVIKDYNYINWLIKDCTNLKQIYPLAPVQFDYTKHESCLKIISENAKALTLYNEPLLQNPITMDREIINFITEEKEVYNPSLNLENIKGASYSHGYEHASSWGDMLRLLRRYEQYASIACDATLQPSIAYYLNDKWQNDDPWGIQYVNGYDYGFVLEGHNRTTIAKYLSAIGKIPKDISCFKYARYVTVDWDSYKKFKKLISYLDKLPNFVKGYVNYKLSRKEKSRVIDEVKLTHTYSYITFYSINVDYEIDNKNKRYIIEKSQTESFIEFKKEFFKQIRKSLEANSFGEHQLFRVNL